MENLEYTTLEHLVFNASFKRWVLTNAEADAAYWHAWLQANPAKASLANEACAVVQALQLDFTTHTNQELNKEISIILQKLDGSVYPKPADEETRKSTRLALLARLPVMFKIAAAIVILFVAGYLIVGQMNNGKTEAVKAFTNKDDAGGYVQMQNTTAALQLVHLPDGSTVSLHPKSSVVYAKKFVSQYREVYLKGEAFFEVTKNAQHPFLVYTSNIVTRVLGTSFNIISYPNEKKATVMVKTGKVSVFKRASFTSAAISPEAGGAKIITANQQAIFNMDETKLQKTIVEKPVIIASLPVQQQGLVFSATPVSDVFTKLQQLYCIPIVYDGNVLANCSLSASLEDETFYEKLDIICKAINATYTTYDGNIIISSKGCK